ncbi:chaperone modulator CbpM [Conexibacter stalactiti]|uniref:Chaperone modulator CbpM n=1 Tax=Conexibacter stalactiti TaxID=1940611 RepID=A0ABU4HIJ0_9ACTN|nr:chaperone modulator CbpM [Conexibacter stalactiti]MDW5593131.1 chaperone modulator CbpM [Conexibacter stalactiti]MEC5033772.1 chaperone modulator CbpM [Conexibacter stalactiti]
MSAPTRTRIAALVVSPSVEQLPLEAVARRAGLHPELVRRLVALGALEPIAGTRTAPRFSAEAASRLTLLLRLRRDLGLNWAGALLALDLLDRIDTLQARLARYEHPTERGR